MAIKTFSDGNSLPATDINTYLTNAGLVYVTSASVTSGSTFTFNNCFTSTYDNYRLVLSNFKSTAFASLSFNLRVSGTNSATGYQQGLMYILFSSAAGNFTATTTGTSWTAPAATNTSPPVNGTMEIYQPAIATQTGLLGHYQGFDATTFTGGSHTSATAYDGFQLTSSGTFTAGTVTVYGYRKA
jgi:hypothetical protein